MCLLIKYGFVLSIFTSHLGDYEATGAQIKTSASISLFEDAVCENVECLDYMANLGANLHINIHKTTG